MARSGTARAAGTASPSSPAARARRDPPRPARRSGGHAQPLYRGGGERRADRLPLPAQRQSGRHRKVRLQAGLDGAADRARRRAARRSTARSCSPATITSSRPTRTSTSPSAGSTTRCSSPSRAPNIAACSKQGWTDAIRQLHPDETIFTFWDYWRNAFARNAGIRIDHLLLNKAAAKRLQAAGVDTWVRAREKAQRPRPNLGHAGRQLARCIRQMSELIGERHPKCLAIARAVRLGVTTWASTRLRSD